MKITDLRLLKSKVVIFFNDEKLEVSPNTYTEFNLYINKTITPKTLNEIKAFDSYSKDLNYALGLINKYAYTTFKLKKKLIDKKISEANIKKILTYLTKHKLLDDEAFAINYAESLIYRHKGSRFIKERLKELGISDNIISQVLTKLNQKTIDDELIKYIKKLDKRYSQKPTVDKLDKIKRACLNSGYSFSEVNHALTKVKLAKTNYGDAINLDYQKFKRQYDERNKIFNALRRKGYSYSKIKSVMEEDL